MPRRVSRKMPKYSPEVHIIMRQQQKLGKPVTPQTAMAMNRTNKAGKKGQLGKGWK
jgi:hypothetical protein